VERRLDGFIEITAIDSTTSGNPFKVDPVDKKKVYEVEMEGRIG
jgi:hypothetical protein